MVPNKTNANGKKGVALIAAIAVLAILTLLMMGLAYSASASRHNESRAVSRERASHLARLGFDLAVVTLSRASTPLTEPKELKVSLEEEGTSSTTCLISGRPATPTDSIYAGNFIKPRPGDTIITVEATISRGAATQTAKQSYLLNVSPAQPRRLLYEETVSDMAPQKQVTHAVESTVKNVPGGKVGSK
jgi:hypothetical protein